MAAQRRSQIARPTTITIIERPWPRVWVFSFCRNMRRARRRELAPSTARLAVVAAAATDEPRLAPVVDGNAGQRLAPGQSGTHDVSEEPGDSYREGVGSVAAIVAVSIRQRHQICSPTSVAPGLMRAFSIIESSLLKTACPDSPEAPLAVTAKAEPPFRYSSPILP